MGGQKRQDVFGVGTYFRLVLPGNGFRLGLVMAAGEGKYIIAAVEKAVRVENFLARGDLLAYKTAAEVARGAFVSQNEAFRILKTLASCGRVEQGEGGGFRIGRTGLISIAVYAHEYMMDVSGKIGLRRGM